MPEVPLLSGREVITALSRLGFVELRQRGSHVRLAHSDGRRVSVPYHPVIGRGLLRKILRDADVVVDDFLDKI